jgi:hypothetical protein
MSAAVLQFQRPIGRGLGAPPRPPPPFDIDRVIAAARRRAPRLSAVDLAFVDALAERRRVSDRERWRLINVADRLNLPTQDRG